jgi:hypothetical protein
MERLTIDDAYEKYLGQWIVMHNFDGDITVERASGEVLFTSFDEDEAYREAIEYDKHTEGKHSFIFKSYGPDEFFIDGVYVEDDSYTV